MTPLPRCRVTLAGFELGRTATRRLRMVGAAQICIGAAGAVTTSHSRNQDAAGGSIDPRPAVGGHRHTHATGFLANVPGRGRTEQVVICSKRLSVPKPRLDACKCSWDIQLWMLRPKRKPRRRPRREGGGTDAVRRWGPSPGGHETRSWHPRRVSSRWRRGCAHPRE